MKKLMCLLLICLISGMTFAQSTAKPGSPSVDNPSIRKSKKAQEKQTKEFTGQKRYSNVVKGPKPKGQKQQQAKEKNVPKG
jgi:hypothetical protein